jgi:hypothetical protein
MGVAACILIGRARCAWPVVPVVCAVWMLVGVLAKVCVSPPPTPVPGGAGTEELPCWC